MKQYNFSGRILKAGLPLLFLIFSVHVCRAQTITSDTQGTHDGFFYSFWNDNQRGTASMTLGAGGNYKTTWNNINNFTAGKGWKVGSADRVVCFEGSYDGGSNGFLAVYGWTKDPLIEYYVVESYGSWTPPGNTSDIIKKGSFQSDGGTYNVYTSTRTNMPSIVGTATFQQYWSVRTTKRSTGTVTFANHIAAWKGFGMKMGTTWDYQIMESEGYQSTGSSNITVSDCSSSASSTTVAITAPAVSAPFTAPATVAITATAKSSNGTINKVEFYNGTKLLGEDASSPYTYSWTNVAAGTYTITAVATDNKAVKTTSEAVTVKVNVPQAPYGGTARAIPGTVQFEEYDEGGNGVAYFDSSPGTSVSPAPNFRTDEDVDIETCTDIGGGYNLGYTIAGEWLEYTVNVAAAGKYTLTLRVACNGTDRTVALQSDGTAITGDVKIPDTGDWQIWEDVTVKDVQLKAGKQVIRITIGATDYVNLNYMKFEAASAATPPTVAIISPADKSQSIVNQTVTVNATASSVESKIVDVMFYNGTQLISTDDLSPFSAEWKPTVAGSYTIKAVATDATGAKSETSILLNVVNAPVVKTVALKAGWNIIGCPIEGSTDIAKALSSIWAQVEAVKDHEGFYLTTNSPAMNSLTTVEYGRGYMVKVSANCSLDWIVK